MDTAKWLDRCIVTGVGEAEYQAVRFMGYAYASGHIYPHINENDPLPCKLKNKVSGQKVLIDLYELYIALEYKKFPKLSKARRASMAEGVKYDPQADMIVEWCRTHFHPYAMHDIANTVEDILESQAFSEPPIDEKDHMDMLLSETAAPPSESCYADRLEGQGGFSKRQFLYDLRGLASAVQVYHSIMGMREEKDASPAQALSRDGRTQEGMEALAGDILSGKRSYEDCIEEFCYLCKPINMQLTYDPRHKSFDYAPVFDSAFDIAWFALYRIAISNERYIDTGNRKLGTIQCRACGRTVTKTGPNQKYCNRPECQAFKEASRKRKSRSL